MAKDPVAQIVAMLDDDAPERRMAAVIVLGELKARGPNVKKRLLARLADDAPAVQRHVLETLRRVGVGKRGAQAIWPLLASRDAGVRGAAAEAIAGVGAAVVPDVRARLSEAEGEERRALESVLSRLGGKEAFDALLDALADGDEESNRATALELRAHLRAADGKTRRAYRGRLERFLARRGLSGAARAAGVKVLGFLEDPATAKTLLAIAKDKRAEAAVRQEAWIALRFTLRGGASADVIKALVDAASADDRALAQTALMTLATLEVPASLAPKLSALALHRDLERARMAIDKLGSLSGAKATQTLVAILAEGDKRRAEMAAEALAARADAVSPLVAWLAGTDELERAKLARAILAGKKLTAAQRKKLLDGGAKQLAAGAPSWEATLPLVKEHDPKGTAKRLRADAARLKKGRRPEAEARVLRALLRLGLGADAERYRLASLTLKASALDPRGRRSDPAIRGLLELARGDFDVVNALKKDRAIGLEELYYVGFCFVEEDAPGGEELLEAVVTKGGRKKIAKAAKNKLKLGA